MVDYINQSCFHRANAPCLSLDGFTKTYIYIYIYLVYVVQKMFVFAETTILFIISCVRYAFKIVPISKDYQRMATPISAMLMGVARVTSFVILYMADIGVA